MRQALSVAVTAGLSVLIAQGPPALAQPPGWVPSNEPPRWSDTQVAPPGSGYQQMPRGATSPGIPDMPGYGMPPQGYPSQLPPGISGPDQGGGPMTLDFAGMRMTQDRTDAAYTLDIALNGADPGQVEITPTRGGLVIVSNQSAQTEREETFDDGRGYRRSFSWSGGRSVKRLPVPPDGDLGAMQRDDADGTIHITIPRVAAPRPEAPQPGSPQPSE